MLITPLPLPPAFAFITFRGETVPPSEIIETGSEASARSMRSKGEAVDDKRVEEEKEEDPNGIANIDEECRNDSSEFENGEDVVASDCLPSSSSPSTSPSSSPLPPPSFFFRPKPLVLLLSLPSPPPPPPPPISFNPKYSSKSPEQPLTPSNVLNLLRSNESVIKLGSKSRRASITALSHNSL